MVGRWQEVHEARELQRSWHGECVGLMAMCMGFWRRWGVLGGGFVGGVACGHRRIGMAACMMRMRSDLGEEAEQEAGWDFLHYL